MFLKNAWKDNKAYKKYEKNEGKAERKFFKAVEKVELSDKQIKDAKRLQRNTFKTFNKIDENSQKYAENIEALGQSVSMPILLTFSLISSAFASPYMTKSIGKSAKSQIENFAKAFFIMFAGVIPAIGVNAMITKAQKKASRIADMLSINEMKDYREFRGDNIK